MDFGDDNYEKFPPAVTAEERKENKEDFGGNKSTDSVVNGARAYSIILFLLGLGSILCLIPLFSEYENYTNIRSPLAEIGSDFVYELTLPFAVVGTGAGMIIAGGVSLIAYMKNNKVAGYIAMVLALICVGVQIYAAITIQTRLEQIRVKLEGNPVEDSFTEGEKSIMDFTSAVFNHCCLSQYDSRNYTKGNMGQLERPKAGGGFEDADDNQRPVGECQSTLDTTCPLSGSNRMFPAIIEQLVSAAPNLFTTLCQCISKPETVQKTIEILDRDGLCEAYRNIVVEDADSRSVPTTPFTFETLVLALQAFRPEYAGQLPIGKFAFVGKILPPSSVYGEPSEKIGWSCGLGYAKGDAYYMYLYIEDTTKGMIIGAIVTAALAAICTGVLFLFWVSGGGSTEDEVLEYGYDDYELTSKNPMSAKDTL